MARRGYITQNNKVDFCFQYFKKEVSDEIDFSHVDKHKSWHSDKHQSFPQVYFNTLGVKVSKKLILVKLNLN